MGEAPDARSGGAGVCGAFPLLSPETSGPAAANPSSLCSPDPSYQVHPRQGGSFRFNHREDTIMNLAGGWIDHPGARRGRRWLCGVSGPGGRERWECSPGRGCTRRRAGLAARGPPPWEEEKGAGLPLLSPGIIFPINGRCRQRSAEVAPARP